jgi:hypothetical protein
MGVKLGLLHKDRSQTGGVFENMAIRRTFRAKRDEITDDLR